MHCGTMQQNISFIISLSPYTSQSDSCRYLCWNSHGTDTSGFSYGSYSVAAYIPEQQIIDICLLDPSGKFRKVSAVHSKQTGYLIINHMKSRPPLTCNLREIRPHLPMSDHKHAPCLHILQIPRALGNLKVPFLRICG